MADYEHIFFDLDHTLWDFQTNSRATLLELYTELGLAEKGVGNAEEMIEVYEAINFNLWDRYQRGKIDKDVLRVLRFRNTLLQFGIRDEPLAKRIGERYTACCPLRTALVPGTMEVLEHLTNSYTLHIITNGFQEVQSIKIAGSGIEHFFDQVVTSEQAKAKKPDPRIFQHAFKRSGANAKNSIMIGDSLLADVGGAKAVGMDQVHFDPQRMALGKDCTHRINSLPELIQLL